MRIAMFDTKDYDRESFEKYNNLNDVNITYFDTKLSLSTVSLTKGFDGVCVFVNDTVNKEVIDALYQNGVKFILLRCAGYNNVDVKACYGKIHVYHVPAYSPYAVAEHAMALLLTSIRRIHKAYNRTRTFILKPLQISMKILPILPVPITPTVLSCKSKPVKPEMLKLKSLVLL